MHVEIMKYHMVRETKRDEVETMTLGSHVKHTHTHT